MGIRDELQTEVAAAFDTDLQDAVKISLAVTPFAVHGILSRKPAVKRW
jgi:hypothetical protein